ncbi:MAG: hypothetical protein EZS28_007927 [Streblomastix strix]|uniref:Uncharacterized protein n=1 Tax=Streblomastix strix TaxID=222440 RepID=A0A5J4WNQ1_9EUKA|nr:MAG: hypothetical protein EZS28_007927 [Streblomastix strix]
MLVSSLVNQTQLQEVRDIASGKSKAYVFYTQENLNDWMIIQDYDAYLVIGDSFYIVDKEVTDYWWDRNDIKILETELPDMSNVISTLGAVTGGGKAINDILISGNTLTSAKNTTFVTINYDQNISGSKTFTSTIHSVGISVQNYDNSNNDLAVSGVRAISDIITIIDLKNYYNKSQAYSQIVTNNLLNIKAKIGDSYSKGEDDLLLFAKAEIDQLILKIEIDDIALSNYYSKTKTDELLDEKFGTADLANYETLGTSQTITANKTFNNSCQFVSAIYGMSTIIETSFIKSGANNTTFMSNISATGIVKAGKDNTSVLPAGGGDVLLSSFTGLKLVNITYTCNEVSQTQIVVEKCLRYGQLINFYSYIYMGAGTGTSCASVAVCTLDNAGFPKIYIESSIGSVDQIIPIKGNNHITIASVYYTDYEPLKRAISDVNGNRKINIVDDWHVNSIIDGMKSMSWVQDVVQKQTEAIGVVGKRTPLPYGIKTQKQRKNNSGYNQS